MRPQLFDSKNWTARAALLAAGAFLVLWVPPATAGNLYAVVPTHTIYPNEEISAAKLEELEVTNPNLKGDFAQSISQVAGMLSTRTLLPGHAIYLSTLRQPYTVTRDNQVRLVFQTGSLEISAMGQPLQDGSVGEIIRVRNADSGLVVSGTVLDDGSVKVLQQ